MESIAAYADEDSSASLNENGPSDQDEVSRGEDTIAEKGDIIDAVDDNAEDGYRKENSAEEGSDDNDESRNVEENSKDPSLKMENPEELQEGELSMSLDTAPKESSRETDRTDENSSSAGVENQLDEETGKEVQSDQNGLEEEEGQEDDDQERVLPQALTTPFSLASFLSSVAPKIKDESEDQSSECNEQDLEFAYINGTYARVTKSKVDINELDRRLDDLRELRREEIGLLRMYGLDDREDRAGGRDGDPRARGRDRDDDSRGGERDRDGDTRGGGRNRDEDPRARGKDRDDDSRGDKDRDQGDGGNRRSRSRSKDRDREKRRSRSRERRRSRSRERRRSRSRDRSSRRERESPDKSRGRDERDRYSRDGDRSGRDRDDKGRDRDRFGRDKDRTGRERDREDKKDEREHGHSRSPRNDRRSRSPRNDRRSRSPRNDRRDSNSRFLGRGEGSSLFRESEKTKNDTQEKYGDRRGSEGPYSRKQDTGYSGGQDFYPSQQPPMPMPVPPPDSFPQNQFQGPQGFSQPPPPLEPFNAAIPPPQPWMGTAPSFQQVPPQHAPLPPHLGSFSQPPPPFPPSGIVNPMNNGDINSLKQSLAILTGAGADPSGRAQGYGGHDTSQPPPSSWAMDTAYSDSGPRDDDPMDLDLPTGSDDYQSRVVEEVKNAIRPFFINSQISKDDYREILKKCVPKVASSGEINTKKISNLVAAYVKKMRGRAK